MTVSTSRLEQVLAAIATQVQTRIPSCAFPGLGAQWVPDQSSAPPRIVWVRGVDRYGPPERVGGNQRPVLGKDALVLAHCWAQGTAGDDGSTDDYALEALTDALVWALRTVLGPDALPASAQHLSDAPGSAGRCAVVTFVISQPVTDNDLPTATVDTVAPDTAGTAQGDGVLQCGETT